MITQYFLENLSTLMEANGLNQINLAKQLGVSQSTVNNWWRKKSIPRDETLNELAKFLKVEPYYFFMTPGSQGSARPVERHDSFKTLLDDLAQKCLNPIELKTYQAEGHEEFVRVLRMNYETDHILTASWCLKLTQELNKYTSIDLEEKLKGLLGERASAAKKA
nr:hypothetical protein BHI3_07780 [Bacteriovorax sp. HI3]